MSEVKHLPVDPSEDGVRLDRWFKRRFPHIKHGQLEKMLRKGEIRVDSGRVKSNTRLEAGQEVRVPPLPAPEETPDQPGVPARDAKLIRSLILYEDETMIALNKPSGLAVQGGSKTTRHIDGMLPALERNGETPRLVHRLDRDTSGVLIVAKTTQEAARLAKLFKGRDLQKIYWAIALGAPRPREGVIKGHVRKAAGMGDNPDREQMVFAEHGDEGARYSLTDYAVVAEAGRRASWVALKPMTGRTHQLRVHMAAAGHAILGDGKYVCDIPTPEGLDKRLHLHARSLTLPTARGGTIEITAPLPDHMANTFNTFGFDPAAYMDPFA
ncbi:MULTISPECIES: RluA family pseudouridine synthase [Euryhalocaulis]|uniref:RluA family pseudouridine synthase n=1 Tax=Euryhalocaulis TaxID=1712422 RepID=UPI00039F8532|nr:MULTISPECIES: RluA family pseudouridine synthase [Euryhalocaulis]MBA4802708.1 RluA family pseudouridine synthase [Euryhalocaulis sp.]